MLQDKDPELFYMARVGLGCLGVVAELTLQCVPAHELLQHTQVMTRQQVHQNHTQLLQTNKHLRYMWLPYTDSVVVVTCNPHKEVSCLRLQCIPSWARHVVLACSANFTKRSAMQLAIHVIGVTCTPHTEVGYPWLQGSLYLHVLKPS